jgi:hypothetical protein
VRQAEARKLTDAYLHAPKRSDRHLHAVGNDAFGEPAPPADVEERPRLEEPASRVIEDLRVEAPEIEIPDWAEPFSDPRWDDRLGWPDYEERDGRRTVFVTGRPEGKAVPRRDGRPGSTARERRQTPPRARLAGRPDRVALWAVGLGLLMAAMAGLTGNGHSHSSQQPAAPAPAPLLSR